MKCYAADFEATVELIDRNGDERVYVTWAGLQSCDTMKCQKFQTRYKGNTFIHALDSFMNTVARLNDGSVVLFHNLKGYDHAFIFTWALENGIKLFGSPQDFYVKFGENRTIRFFDTLNLITTSIKDMAEMVDLKKGGDDEIETPLVSHFDKYSTTIRYDNKLTGESRYETLNMPLEKAFKYMKWDIYAEYDCEILARGIKLFEIDKLLYNRIVTKASWAWQMLWKADYSKSDVSSWLANIGGKVESKYSFSEDPTLKIVNDMIQKAYKGGISYVNPIHQGKRYNRNGRTYDINSMYPWIYSTMHLPQSKPYGYTHSRADNFEKILDKEELAIIELVGVKAELKEGVTMPLIKNRSEGSNPNDRYYLPTYEGTLTITSIEWRYMRKHYNFTYEHGTAMLFKRDYQLEDRFRKHCAYWYGKKLSAKNEGERFIAKLMLNAAYGKVAQYTKILQNGKYELVNGIITKKNYKRLSGSDYANLAAGAFITAYGRVYLAEAINAYGDDFVYCDTDSLHVFGDKELIPVGTSLGEFKLELEWIEGCWLNPKTYMERGIDGNWKCCTAGNSRPIDIESFEIGNTIYTPRRKYVRGGVLIELTPFTLGASQVNFSKLDNKLKTLEW